MEETDIFRKKEKTEVSFHHSKLFSLAAMIWVTFFFFLKTGRIFLFSKLKIATMKKKMVYLQTCTWLEQQKREIGITEIETGQKTSRKETTNTCSLLQLPPQTSICHLRIIYEPRSHIKASLCCPFSLTPSLPKGIRGCLY